MNVAWWATEVRSRLFCAVPVHSGWAGLDDRFQHLRRRRIRGYVEVAFPDAGSRRLSIGFRGLYAVVRSVGTDPAARSFLLGGDGSVPDGAYVQVPVRDDLIRFDGEFVLDVEHAWELVHTFVRTGETGDLGHWHLTRPGPAA
ncbi:hypothetical protein Aab01nite_05670 [Paractinoplanes abujensis]|uniref:Uncharacterized protein n=1 Tax=Paractinoplanes abujensis TaxID=882441 RepID=A0A7W7CN27_9ACTN|nr:hypothetical protein [Actinoplanes abujensis]MBB4691604.1 hypothetical protein [Actinoplanes abujensis]GID16977.1 hypothetical protein Aab01nite_05670 [Actinoplanes abujensis]